MFDLPETKRVRRTDLYSPSPSPSRSPSPAPHLDLNLDFISVAPPPSAPDNADADGDLNMDFALFSNAPQKITLKDPTPPPSDEDAWERVAREQKRPMGYYVLSEAEMAARRAFVRDGGAVVEGGEVLEGAKVVWPGCRVPWKVTSIKGPDVVEKGTGRKKPGKKRRVFLRKVAEEKRKVEEARLKSIEGRKKYAGLSKEERDLREREDRSKRNREKKLKRRERERAKKAAAKVAAGEVGVVMEDSEEGGGGCE